MAEFQTVMQEAARMCKAHDECGNCALREMADRADIYCPIQTMRKLDAAKVEAAVMDWAAENPEARYPTWKEWQNENFPDASHDISPCSFGAGAEFDCDEYECDECRGRPIPADIAEKLGIKPIGGAINEE